MAEWGASCRFQLAELSCNECGKPSGVEETCADIAYCSTCRKMYVELIGETEAAEMFEAIALNPMKTPWGEK